MAVLTALILVLNVCDLVLTHVSIQRGMALEGNRLMAFLFQRGLVEATLFKLAAVGMGCAALWLARRRPLAILAAIALATVFVALVTYEVLWLVA